MYELPRPLEQMKMEARRDDWHITFVGSDIRQLIGTIEELQAIVDKLPKTADGVVIMPGMTVFELWKTAKDGIASFVIDCWCEKDDCDPIEGSEVYSTKAAAQAAKENQDGN